MDPVTVAAVLAPVLAPFLRRAGSELRDSLAARLGRDAAESLGDLWDRLRGRLPEPASDGAAPDEAAATLEQQLARLLAEHPDLLRQAESVAITVRGDHNVVQHGSQNIVITGGSDIHIGNG
jgi:hypothetical protein